MGTCSEGTREVAGFGRGLGGINSGQGGAEQQFPWPLGKTTAAISEEKTASCSVLIPPSAQSACVASRVGLSSATRGPKKGSGRVPVPHPAANSVAYTNGPRPPPKCVTERWLVGCGVCVHPSVSDDWGTGDNSLPSQPLSGREVISSGWRPRRRARA